MSLYDREQAFEKEFSENQKNAFRVEARASRLIGYWAADKIGLTSDEKENYAKDVISSNLDEPGYDDVRRKISADFEKRGIAFDDREFDMTVEKSVAEATEQLKQGL